MTFNPDKFDPNQEAAFESFRNRKAEEERAKQSAISDLDKSLSPERLAEKIRTQKALSDLASEEGSSDSFRIPRDHYDYSRNRRLSGRLPISLLALITAGVFWGGSVAVTESTYPSEKGQQFLEQQGYTGVELTSTNVGLIQFTGCGEGDVVQYEYDAIAQNGEHVGMMVCKGLFKGATVRQG